MYNFNRVTFITKDIRNKVKLSGGFGIVTNKIGYALLTF